MSKGTKEDSYGHAKLLQHQDDCPECAENEGNAEADVHVCHLDRKSGVQVPECYPKFV